MYLSHTQISPTRYIQITYQLFDAILVWRLTIEKVSPPALSGTLSTRIHLEWSHSRLARRGFLVCKHCLETPVNTFRVINYSRLVLSPCRWKLKESLTVLSVTIVLSTGHTGWLLLNTWSIHARQNRCPHSVCTGFLIANKQMGHSCLFSSGSTNLASYPACRSLICI